MENEPLIRAALAVAMLLLIALWELAFPRRKMLLSRRIRWTSNFGLFVVNSLLVRLFFPASAVGFALLAERQQLGLLPQLSLPAPAAIIISVIVLDCAIWFQHRIFHQIPLLWRLHRVHHADRDFDFTTGLRFHPLEILLSILIKGVVICILGAPASAVLIFEALLNASSIFNHGNIKIPLNIDRVLRRFIVTPDMHRVHHSSLPAETNSNFGFNLSLWDHLFGSYRAQPASGHADMDIGLEVFREAGDQRITQLLGQPFRKA